MDVYRASTPGLTDVPLPPSCISRWKLVLLVDFPAEVSQVSPVTSTIKCVTAVHLTKSRRVIAGLNVYRLFYYIHLLGYLPLVEALTVRYMVFRK